MVFVSVQSPKHVMDSSLIIVSWEKYGQKEEVISVSDIGIF